MQRHWKILEWLSPGILFLTGALGASVAILDLLGTDMTSGPWVWIKGPQYITLLIVAMLALTVGIERFKDNQQLHQEIDQLQDSIRRAVGGQLLANYEELYDMAIYMVHQARVRIRATSIGHAPHRPTRYSDAIAEQLRKSKSRKRPIFMDVVAGADFATAKEALQSKVKSRRSLYENSGVGELVTYHAIDLAWSLDFLAIDNAHLLIKFPPSRGLKEFTAGIAFLNQPVLVEEFCRWFDDFLIGNAVRWPGQEVGVGK